MWAEREAIAGRVNVDAVLRDAQWALVASNVGAAADVAAEFGLRCVFHHHAGTYIETPAEIARLMDLTDIGLCLDTGHYIYGGGDPVDAIGRFGRRVEYLHFKDVDPAKLEQARQSKLGFLDGVRAGVFAPLGSGSVRFPALLDALNGIDYDGWAVVEQDVDASDINAPRPADSARQSREYLRKVGLA
jgi:inosose dehydratase